MLYDLELRLKRLFLNLPLGMGRLWISTSFVWLGLYLVLNWNDLSLLWKGAVNGPNATCAEVLANDPRRATCETVNGLPDINFYLQGKSKPFDPYFEKYRRDDKFLIWLGAPIALLVLIWLAVWVRQGFKEEQNASK